MSNTTPEPVQVPESTFYGEFDVMPSQIDYFEKGANMSGLETRVVFTDE